MCLCGENVGDQTGEVLSKETKTVPIQEKVQTYSTNILLYKLSIWSEDLENSILLEDGKSEY